MHFEKKCTGHSRSSWDLLRLLFELSLARLDINKSIKKTSYSELQLHNEEQQFRSSFTFDVKISSQLRRLTIICPFVLFVFVFCFVL